MWTGRSAHWYRGAANLKVDYERHLMVKRAQWKILHTGLQAQLYLMTHDISSAVNEF